MEETFKPWLQQTLGLMLPLLPVAADYTEAPPVTDLPPPLYAMQTKESLNGSFDQLRLHNNGIDNLSAPPQAAPARKMDQVNGHGSEPLKPDDWIWACLVKNERVTTVDWWQDVRNIELDIEDRDMPSYPPGAICSLQPRMSRKEVDDFLEMNGLTDQADDVFYLKPVIHGPLYTSYHPPSMQLTLQTNPCRRICHPNKHLHHCGRCSPIIWICAALLDGLSSSG